MFEAETVNETSPQFIIPQMLRYQQYHTKMMGESVFVDCFHNEIRDQLKRLYTTLDEVVESVIFNELAPPLISERRSSLIDSVDILLDEPPSHVVGGVFQYSVGVIFGRWDIRNAIGHLPLPTSRDPFSSLPICAPGTLQNQNGFPSKPDDVSSNYPILIDWDGILVDDPEHEDDILHRVRDVLEVIWKERTEAIEREACEILGVRELRDYFRKPGNGGFWMYHVKRYSKSRRKAPIYWYLRSAKGNYGLWLYYHRLDKDILYKALLNYVEPKIRLEEDRLRTLRELKEASGSSGREAKQIEKDMDRQEQFVSELRDFADKLRRAADLHLDPDLNDGVVLNIAPLWEMVPWNEPKKYWEELQEGKYDWSHIAYQLWPERVIKLCKNDRSIAIAHGREDLYDMESQFQVNDARDK